MLSTMSFRNAALVATLGLSCTANAHLFIQSPTPIQGSAPKDPLDASGSNFPCHGVSLPSSGGQKMAAGSSQVLAFELGDGANTAVHGGGSCQISVTYETEPAAIKDPSNWHVIYSIEGGCPSNTHQNLDSSYQGPQGTYSGALACSDPKTNGVDCVNSFNFTIPAGMKSGAATLGWTWFNSVGNREMYMNCASIDIEGGDGSEMSDLPSMFVANLANVNSCPTTQSMDLSFPKPGKYVTTKKPEGEAAKTAVTFPMAKPTGEGCSNNGGAAPGGPGYGAGSQSSPSAYPSAAATPSSPASGAPSAAPSAPVPMPTSAASSAAGGNGYKIPTMTTIASTAPSAALAPTGSASAPNTGAGGSCSDGSVSCPSAGNVICIGNDTFGICDADGCAIPQPLAAGTTCRNGTIQKRGLHVPRHPHGAGRSLF
ncbi:hypothetical protein KC331_g9504 [Hortaea werneckii]|uniref:Lytic polysaccharide monooxygenase n=1 Tax=Hortaea werneckii TaxID=91943 RepID=A0A3M7C9U2_HORWE|nr:hypothetical protein KC331_g9504 [Hortaea werneckii]RMY48848.1 hypothetical protein D0865_07847 [Hortaea werneckii]